MSQRRSSFSPARASSRAPRSSSTAGVCSNPGSMHARRDKESELALDCPAKSTHRKDRLAPAARCSDGELLQRIAGGDRDAFDVLYRRFVRPVFALALRRLGDRGCAEDATQETFTSIWRSASSYRTERGPGAPWLYAVARNAIVDRARARSETPTEVPDEASSEPGPPDEAERPRPAARGRAAARVAARARGAELRRPPPAPERERVPAAAAPADGRRARTRGGDRAHRLRRWLRRRLPARRLRCSVLGAVARNLRARRLGQDPDREARLPWQLAPTRRGARAAEAQERRLLRDVPHTRHAQLDLRHLRGRRPVNREGAADRAVQLPQRRRLDRHQTAPRPRETGADRSDDLSPRERPGRCRRRPSA